MKTNVETEEKKPRKGEPETVQVICEVLDQDAVIHGCHHAKGKHLTLPKAEADVLVALDPPAVKVVGVG